LLKPVEDPVQEKAGNNDLVAAGVLHRIFTSFIACRGMFWGKREQVFENIGDEKFERDE